jgi:HD-like signal output (HDOD) protein
LAPKVFRISAEVLQVVKSPSAVGAARPPGPDELVRHLDQLPATAAVLPHLLRLLKSDSASLSEVIELIRVDSAITARCLQMGSSTYYNARGTPCESVAEAVHRVGFNEVYKLVSYAATAQLLMRPLAPYHLQPEETWQRSVSCALAAEQLADYAGVNRNLAYTAGLLHGVGMIAVDAWMHREAVDLHFDSDELPGETVASETRLLGYTNAEVGAALLRLWEFPAAIVEPVRWQYEPAKSREEPLLACLLHVAKWLRDAAHIPEDQPLPNEPEKWILETLNLDSSDLEIRLYQVRDAFLAAARLLGN